MTHTELPKGKQTSLGLYITAKEAYETWKATPESCKLIDVRTVEEYLFLGHAAKAWNIPLALQSYDWDQEKQMFKMVPNPNFMADAKALAQTTDKLFVMCRSGGRSAMAVNALAQAGFTNVYNIVDGFEGDLVQDPDSVFNGQRLKNGWKNSEPWTYDVDPSLMKLPLKQ
ncbi:MAG: sulfurtransferase [Saprospiraceae bacterium]|nr:sulfurtransferase [Saprospiraceae bacterium]